MYVINYARKSVEVIDSRYRLLPVGEKTGGKTVVAKLPNTRRIVPLLEAFSRNLCNNMADWRAAGLNYINYSNIAARMVRKALKPALRADAARREESHIKMTKWKDGKSEKSATEA